MMKQRSLVLAALLTAAALRAQTTVPKTFSLSESVPRPISNIISDIVADGDRLWFGTGRGLMMTDDNGATFQDFRGVTGMGRGSVSAIAVSGDVIWVATAIDSLTDSDGELPAGTGLSRSDDGGQTWHHVPQPVDDRNETEYSPTTTPIQNLTYDIAITPDAVWIVSFGGGLRKSVDNGATWQVVTVDGLPFSSAEHLSHRLFSAHYDGEWLWVGSAAGIHRTGDGGENWTTMSSSQPDGISGNFVVAITSQQRESGKRVWAATIEAVDEGEIRAVSFSDDEGLTWTVVLKGEFCHNFGLDPESEDVYLATDSGIYRSCDGLDWALYATPVDEASGRRILNELAGSTAHTGDALWGGFEDGLAVTDDNGFSWTVFRAFAATGQNGEPDTYAYPNPFSPGRHNQMGGDGHVRIQYHCDDACDVTVRIYDFSMSLVREVADGRARGAGDWSEIWNGRNELDEVVANGVYHYKLERTGHKTVWGKIMIVN